MSYKFKMICEMTGKIKPLNIWIVNPYGTLPSEGWKEYRSAMLANALSERGHNVTWWISDFVHRTKKYRAVGKIDDPLISKNIKIMSIHSRSYKNNISLDRIYYEKEFGRNFEKLAANEIPPDLIVIGDPSLFYMNNVINYKKNSDCRLIVDVIDLWPELFNVIFPSKIRFLTNYLWILLYKKRQKLIEESDGVVAVSEDYLKTVTRKVKKNIPASVVYWGYVESKGHLPSDNLIERLENFSKIHKNILVYAGSLGDAYDMDIIVKAIKRAEALNSDFGFIIAGDGPRKNDFIKLQLECGSRLDFLGAVNPSDLQTIYKYSDIGLITYVAGSTVAMPIKLFDYLNGGLAILNSLSRDIGQIIEGNQLGINYKPNDLDDFFEKINFLISDAVRLEEIKINALKMANFFNADKQYLNYSKFIESVCFE